MNDRLYRSSTDRVFTGLCGGLAEHFDIDPSFVRLVWVVLDVLTGIFPLLIAYILIALIVPEEPPIGAPGPWSASGPWGGSGTWAGWNGPQSGPAAPAASATPGGPAEPGAPGGTQAEGSGAEAVSAGAGTGAPGAAGGASAGAGAAGVGAADAWGPWGPPPPPGADWRAARAYWRAQRRAERAYWRSQRAGGDASTAGLIVGAILVVVGGLFLLRETVPGFDAALFWPVVLIVVGALLLAGAFRR